MITLNGKTRIFGIIGHPVGHSLSPVMQNIALEAMKLNAVYVPFDVSPVTLEEAVKGLRALGVAGFNVTIPHKSAVIPFLDELDESAEAAGAVNTVHNVEGRLIGHNTDGDGFVRSLREELDYDPQGAFMVVVGAGGAARGAIAALCRAGAAEIVIYNRTVSKAIELAATVGSRYRNTVIRVAEDLPDLDCCLEKASLLVNTTSLGMDNQSLPVPGIAGLPINARIYDMIYAPPVTPMLKTASELGIRGVNGLGMLACQGELAFKIWTGQFPPAGLMKRALDNICIS